MNKRVFIKTFGCQMNVYDSERMMAALATDGYVQTDEVEDAELVIMNTCHIREKAVEKVYSDLGRLKKTKVAHPDLKVAITGCVAQAEGAEIIRRQPMVDLVIGPQSYHRLPEMLARLSPGEALVDTDFPVEDKFDYLPDGRKTLPVAAFLSVQEGCDKFCTFCVVPYTRGSERSRPVMKILDEAKRMVDAGVREINLLGQNVNGYHGEDETGKEIGLAELIDRLSEIANLWRIRFTTSHPMDMDSDLIAAFGSNDKLMPFLHLPIQAGSDRILSAMNRHHTRKNYIEIIEKIKKNCPDLALSGDFIVGFPGETESDFQETLSIVDEVGQAHGYSFKYSPRPGTPAATMEQVNEDEKADRLNRLQAKIFDKQTEFLKGLLGKQVSVLFERNGKFDGQLIGRTPYNFAAVGIADPKNIGTIQSRIADQIDHATIMLESVK